MPTRGRSVKTPKGRRRVGGKTPEWMLHDIYEPGVSSCRRVTRSQTAFLRVRNTPSDLELFADPTLHQPPGMPHLMVTMKGEYGAVPRTVITKSFGQYIDVDEKLIEKVDAYKR